MLRGYESLFQGEGENLADTTQNENHTQQNPREERNDAGRGIRHARSPFDGRNDSQQTLVEVITRPQMEEGPAAPSPRGARKSG
jgi:hypothetical protein